MATAIYVGDWALAQLWLFWLAPIVGAVIGAVVYKFLGSTDSES
jgi:aquaporin Z